MQNAENKSLETEENKIQTHTIDFSSAKHLKT